MARRSLTAHEEGGIQWVFVKLIPSLKTVKINFNYNKGTIPSWIKNWLKDRRWSKTKWPLFIMEIGKQNWTPKISTAQQIL